MFKYNRLFDKLIKLFVALLNYYRLQSKPNKSGKISNYDPCMPKSDRSLHADTHSYTHIKKKKNSKKITHLSANILNVNFLSVFCVSTDRHVYKMIGI